ncbi:hypothetical protein IWX78_001586 [Mycetocola sp. CAN_C7]|uniref:hypothetical protein n=1 Tax=Mycetocola sp. CAN_C7 TaxID=2787724 RepID=UPI0018CAFAB4
MTTPQTPIQMPGQPGAAGTWSEPPAPEPRTSMSDRSKATIIWAVVGAMLIGAAFAAIGALNRDVYGAGAFVGNYLSKLQARDAAGALGIPGVALDKDELEASGLPEGSSNALLRKAALPELTEVTEVEVADEGGGVHAVTYSYESDGTYGESTFLVKSSGTRFPLIPTWSFEESPIAVVNLAVEHSTVFSVNGFDLDTRAISTEQAPAFDNIVNVQVFTPGAYIFESTSDLLESEADAVLVDQPARVHEAVVTAVPTEDFVAAAQEAVNAQLDACTEQKVLQPTGCPFGIVIDDRISGDPTWSIDDYPEVTIEAGTDAWEIPAVDGDAHLRVDVQSLFDGSITPYDDDVPFSLVGSIYVMSDGTVQATLEEDPNSVE